METRMVLTDDHLVDEMADLTAIENALSDRLANTRRKKDELKQRRIARGLEERHVSDHALIRYMERHKGIDVHDLRGELRALADEAVAAKDGEHHFHPSGVIMVIGAEGQIITVLSPGQACKWVGRKLANGTRIASVENSAVVD